MCDAYAHPMQFAASENKLTNFGVTPVISSIVVPIFDFAVKSIASDEQGNQKEQKEIQDGYVEDYYTYLVYGSLFHST
jgi:hypothetical protein